ncbi:hypothetical protein ACFLZV_06855 [Candidatus Margulisiibacteriota bacterium]
MLKIVSVRKFNITTQTVPDKMIDTVLIIPINDSFIRIGINRSFTASLNSYFQTMLLPDRSSFFNSNLEFQEAASNEITLWCENRDHPKGYLLFLDLLHNYIYYPILHILQSKDDTFTQKCEKIFQLIDFSFKKVGKEKQENKIKEDIKHNIRETLRFRQGLTEKYTYVNSTTYQEKFNPPPELKPPTDDDEKKANKRLQKFIRQTLMNQDYLPRTTTDILKKNPDKILPFCYLILDCYCFAKDNDRKYFRDFLRALNELFNEENSVFPPDKILPFFFCPQPEIQELVVEYFLKDPEKIDNIRRSFDNPTLQKILSLENELFKTNSELIKIPGHAPFPPGEYAARFIDPDNREIKGPIMKYNPVRNKVAIKLRDQKTKLVWCKFNQKQELFSRLAKFSIHDIRTNEIFFNNISNLYGCDTILDLKKQLKWRFILKDQNQKAIEPNRMKIRVTPYSRSSQCNHTKLTIIKTNNKNQLFLEIYPDPIQIVSGCCVTGYLRRQ